MITQKMEDRLALVLNYVRQNDNCTARDIAREVFGGSGDTRTQERSRASGALVILRDRGRVTRTRPEGRYQHGNADRWKVS